jgi:translation elongation factor EF-1alpha
VADFKVGTVKHFYDKLGVAIVEVSNTISVGDTIKFVRGGEELFEQKVESIQVEHEKKDSADKGDVVGLKTERQVKEGAEVYKVQ